MDEQLKNSIARLYDIKLLETIARNVESIKNLPEGTLPKYVRDERRERISNKWHERRLARVKRAMEAYHIDASSLCDCDY